MMNFLYIIVLNIVVCLESRKKVQPMSTETTPQEAQIPTIYVGRKPLLRYVMAVLRLFLSGGASRVKVCARGRMISRAVDVAEILRTRYLPGLVDIESIKTGTEEITAQGRTSRVSTIEILLVKKSS